MINKDQKYVFVTGATGQVGIATVKHLLLNHFNVRVLVRDPESVSARYLNDLGADIFIGDMMDRGRMTVGMAGAYGVVSIQPQRTGKVGSPGAPLNFTEEDQIRLGMNVAFAAKTADVEQLVYISVAMDEMPIPIHHAKWTIEGYIKSLGLGYTIFRPHTFMENYLDDWSGNEIILSSGLNSDVDHFLICTDDIGAFVALAFKENQYFLGKTMELAAEKLNLNVMKKIVEEETGKRVLINTVPPEFLASLHDQILEAFVWLENCEFKPDIDTLYKLYPRLSNFRKWVNTKLVDNC